jgi:hypothetical protein
VDGTGGGACLAGTLADEADLEVGADGRRGVAEPLLDRGILFNFWVVLDGYEQNQAKRQNTGTLGMMV